jgi:hypothetical protein
MDVTAPHINVDEFARRLRAPSRLPHISEPSSRLSPCAPNTGKESIEQLDVRSSPQPHLKPGAAKNPRALDVDDFRRWWRQRLIHEPAENRSHERKPPRMAIALAGIALIGSAIVLKESAPTPLKGPPVAPLAIDIATAQNPGGPTAGTPADKTPPAGLSGARPVTLGVDAQVEDGKASAQATEPQPAPRVPVRTDGTPIASQVSSSGEPGFAGDERKPAVKPASGPAKGADGTPLPQPSFNLQPIGKTEAAIPSAAVDTPSRSVPIGTLARPEQASGAKALQRLVEAVVASSTPAAAPTARSTGWVVQLGAPTSEVEAKRDLKRLNTKYGSALKGSRVGLRKVLVNGETVYRLHIVGLSRNEAASLCSRVKGDGGSCSIVR